MATVKTDELLDEFDKQSDDGQGMLPLSPLPGPAAESVASSGQDNHLKIQLSPLPLEAGEDVKSAGQDEIPATQAEAGEKDNLGDTQVSGPTEEMNTDDFVSQTDTELSTFAIKNFARAMGLQEADVTLNDVEKSPEGLTHWAWLNLNKQSLLGTRQPMHQRFARAIQHDTKSNGIYQDLDSQLKLEFKSVWSVKKSFAFTTERRTIELSFRKEHSDEGTYMNEIQIARELGGVDSVEAQRQTANYIVKCRSMGKPFVLRNDWTMAENFLYVKHLVTATHTKEWKDIVEKSNTVNVWEERAKECRARRNYSVSHGTALERVTLDMLSSSEQGIQGYADMVVAVASKAKAKTQPKSKATAKAKAKACEDKNVNVEKALRSLIAANYGQTNSMTKIAKQIEAEREQFEWARGFLEQLAELGKQKLQVEDAHDAFIKRFAAAVMCAVAMKDLKKAIGDEYQTMLIRSVDCYKPLVDKFAETLTTLEKMADVSGDAASSSNQTAPKKNTTKKRKA